MSQTGLLPYSTSGATNKCKEWKPLLSIKINRKILPAITPQQGRQPPNH